MKEGIAPKEAPPVTGNQRKTSVAAYVDSRNDHIHPFAQDVCERQVDAVRWSAVDGPGRTVKEIITFCDADGTGPGDGLADPTPLTVRCDDTDDLSSLQKSLPDSREKRRCNAVIVGEQEGSGSHGESEDGPTCETVQGAFGAKACGIYSSSLKLNYLRDVKCRAKAG